MDDAPCLKTPDTTAGTMNRRNAQIPGDCGSYFWKNLCMSYVKRDRRLVNVASTLDGRCR